MLGAGAGKSVLALLLTLGLLEDPAVDEPVPLLLPIAGWDDPSREEAAQFAARRLAEDCSRGLGGAGTQELTRNLVERGRVLLVLDGVDEVAADLRVLAVRRLDEYAALGRPLVVTCRGREYEEAVRPGGQILSRAAAAGLPAPGRPPLPADPRPAPGPVGHGRAAVVAVAFRPVHSPHHPQPLRRVRRAGPAGRGGLPAGLGSSGRDLRRSRGRWGAGRGRDGPAAAGVAAHLLRLPACRPTGRPAPGDG